VSTVVLVLGNAAGSEVALRCAAFGSFLDRLRSIQGGSAQVVTSAANPARALAQLGAANGLVGRPGADGLELHYVPSRTARDRVAEGSDGRWPVAIATRHRKAFRRSSGAILRLPLEAAHSDGAGGSAVEVFTTDWSPFPAACAIAVHPAHPLSNGVPAGQDAAFTGRFCRHPLTGDLLPIWAATWVRPEFGTGAVIVNPAHDSADLAFARRVGMPIRFALAPEGYTGEPETWQTPPVIKTGTAIRTGATDGQSYEQAQASYFATLSERGLAEANDDNGVGSFRVAGAAVGGTPIRWDNARNTIAQGGADGAVDLAVAGSPALAILEPEYRGADLEVVAPSAVADSELLMLRLLLAEPGIEESAEEGRGVVLVGGVAGKTDHVADDVLALTLLVGAAASDTLSVKPQLLEPSERFLQTHEKLLQDGSAPEQPVSGETAKAAAQVKGLIQRQDTKQAFTQLYRLQKALAKSEAVGEEDLRRYAVLAYVLTGAPSRYSEPELADAWQQI
jgi:hypothetical protein